MRTTTLTRALRVALTLAGLAALPQFASAQLPIETKEVKIQAGGTSTNAVTMSATTVSTSYTLNFPAAQGNKGGFLYLANSSGQLAFSSTAGLVNGSSPVWDTTGGGAIKWEDPNGANNPNWSRAGNAISGTGTLGATSNQGFNIITNGKVRVGFANTGAITINTTSDGGTSTTIGRDNDHTTNVDGTVNINVATGDATNIATSSSGTVGIGTTGGTNNIAGTTNINVSSQNATNIATSSAGDVNVGVAGGTFDVISTTTLNGSLALGTSTATPFLMGTDGGASGEVLVSKGASATPAWENLNEAVGIRKAGLVTGLSGVNEATVTNVTDLAAGDAIIVTPENNTLAVVAVVSARTPGATGSFTVKFSGTYSGSLSYLVIRERN